MSDETKSDDAREHQITVEQAVRLKNDINKSITYGPGLNAREVVTLKTVSAEQWNTVRRDYDQWARKTQVFNRFSLLIIAVAGVYACIHYVKAEGWVGWAGWAAGMVALYAVGALFKREGHRDGYLEGYDTGFSEGVDKAFGIDGKEAADIQDRAVDMQIDESLIKAFDEKKEQHG